METKAAVSSGPHTPFSIETIDLDEPREYEVLVRITAAGICHTDLAVKRSGRFAPGVLGHEGAGIVERVGSAVTRLRPGDPVVLSYFACHHCAPCISGNEAYCVSASMANFSGGRLDGSKPIRWNGKPIASSFFYQSSFAHHALAHENSAVKVPSDLPLDLLAPLGCGLQTGAGAVLNTLDLQAGQRLAVFGVGTVGLAAIMAAKAAGAAVVIAIDLNASRLALARELGATHTIKADEQDAVAAIKAIAAGGVEFSLECIGSPKVLRQAFDCLQPRGTCGLLGLARPGTDVSIDMLTLLNGRRLIGIIEGDSNPQTFVPRLIEMYRAGQLPFDRLVKYYALAQINEAIADTESGVTVKPILRMA